MKRFFFRCCVIGIYFSLATTALSAPPKKPQFEYLAYPDIMYTDSEGSMLICLLNYGGDGEVSHDGVSGDQVVISVPSGTSVDDLVSTGGVSCESQNPAWVGEVDEISTPDEILLTFRPNGTYTVILGETICFNLNILDINSEIGLSFLNIDQQMKGSARKPVNTAISIFKMTKDMAAAVELDPTVEESVKDGVSFDELSGNATDEQIPDDITMNYAKDADTVDGAHAVDLEESAEIDADIAVHKGDAGAHHSKTTSFSELTDTATDAQIPDSITVNQAANADTVDGAHAADLEESAEIDADIAVHKGDAGAHHSKTTSFSELTDTATDAQIPDSITVDQAANADTVDGAHAADLEESAEIDADIAAHNQDPGAHPEIGGTFTKIGNNGTVSCNIYCGAVNRAGEAIWEDRTGYCVVAKDRSGESVSCNAVLGLGERQICLCAVGIDVLHYNNGTVSCAEFCERKNLLCVAAWNNETNSNNDARCSFVKPAGSDMISELTCSCL